MRGGDPLCGVLWVFLIVVVTGALMRAQADRRKRLAARPPPDDPRWADGPRRQIAGHKCIECGVKVVTANEGEACETCGEVGHVETCLARHARSAHRVETHEPYR